MAKKNKSFYITTPIYYSSGSLHIGHCYTTVACDAIARFKRLDGFDVYYLTGTDEHGQKVQKAAEERCLAPQTFVDGLAERIKTLWARMDISNDGFIRTTDKAHEKAVADIFTKLYEKGDIYKSEYSGKYCEPCESFWTEGQLEDGKCPDCGRPVRDEKQECYFFKLSKYSDRIRKLLTETDFLQPESRVREMVNNFIDKGLNDLAVTRTSFDWGIRVPFDPKHVIYVWIDALPNYLTALGYGGKNDGLYKKYWQCDMHVMAKEIVRFHAIVWPAILMALDVPLPKRVYGHGWIMFGGDKMSKSKGNVVDPFILTDRYGVDALRYYLLSSVPFGDDSNYTNELLLTSINNNLVNDLGNLVRRTLAMSKQYFDGSVKKPSKRVDADSEFISGINALPDSVRKLVDKPELARAMGCIFDVIGRANKYIDGNKPWELKKHGETERLNDVLYNLLEAIRVCATLLLPFLTKYPRRIFDGLGLSVPENLSLCVYGAVGDYSTKEIEPILNRLDVAKELDELEKISEAANSENKKTTQHDKNESDGETGGIAEISIDEFFKTQLSVVDIEGCEKVEKAKKLLKLTVFDGTRRRTIVSGIAAAYAPEDLIGKKAALVANLKPAKLCGIVSEGMLLCSVGADGVPRLVSPTGNAGDKIC